MVVKANRFNDLLLDSDFQQIRDSLKLYKNVCFLINFVRFFSGLEADLFVLNLNYRS